MKSLQLSETCLKPRDGSKTHEFVKEEKKDEEDGWENILDPLCKTRKGRPRKNRIKPTSKKSKKKSDHDGNVPMSNASQNQTKQFTQSQVGVGTFT